MSKPTVEARLKVLEDRVTALEHKPKVEHGEPGPQGVQGAPGHKGDTGEPGETGERGPKGSGFFG